MFGNLGKIMKLVGEMKTKLPEMKAKLEAGRFDGQAGGGAVTATVNGKLALVELAIDPAVLDDPATDAPMLEDLVKAAVASAQVAAAAAAEEAMKELTGGMDLPGMGGLGM